MKWIGQWQYSYKKELISLEMNLSNNTFAFWLHSAKVKQSGYATEWAAKSAAKEYLDKCPIS